LAGLIAGPITQITSPAILVIGDVAAAAQQQPGLQERLSMA
jgi:hypothetical protein